MRCIWHSATAMKKNDKIIKQLTIIIIKQYYNHYTH